MVAILRRYYSCADKAVQISQIVFFYKKAQPELNVLQQAARLVVNLIMVGNFAFLFNCTSVGRTSDSMMVPT